MPDNVATTMDRPQTSPRGWKIAAEIALVFAVFCVQGAWPVPEVNEPNYLGKAIHFWNPAWAPHDFFLQTADTHWVFYFTFGWLSRWLSPTALAWFGRLLTWGLMAWAWRRLSFAVAPQRWLAPLTAALFLAMIQHGNMAGEWVVGGVEAKGFAFVLVFLALESLVGGRLEPDTRAAGGRVGVSCPGRRLGNRGRGNRLDSFRPRAPPLRSLWPGLLGGLIFSLPGLIPATAARPRYAGRNDPPGQRTLCLLATAASPRRVEVSAGTTRALRVSLPALARSRTRQGRMSPACVGCECSSSPRWRSR